MNREKVDYMNIGANQEVPLVSPRGTIFLARLVPIADVWEKLNRSPEDTSLLFTADEILYSRRLKKRPYERFAARLGAKQIILGLIENPEIGWRDVEIINNEFSAPYLTFTGTAQRLVERTGVRGLHVSLAHDGNMALAFCAVEKYEESQRLRIARIGTDICPAAPFEMSRISRTTTFSERELDTARHQEFPAKRLAMYFALKESVIKILETLPGWIWQEIEVNELEGRFHVALSGNAKERLEQMEAAEIITALLYKEEAGALAFSAAIRPELDTKSSQ